MENSADATAATPQMPTTQDGTGVEASPGSEFAEREEGEGIAVVALEPPVAPGPYPPEVRRRIRRDVPRDYARAASWLDSTSRQE